ncbi:hypothetical protein [Dyadobacter sediminis]|uniref:Uncharacterized protein n=1 Tax=Dyadobacter sediminis TaxID=1493691 RepID=A0A5R9K7G6_9BACT|nr:hypothetical protein [Dyadobacter sediminis]TLU89800.1 hypothetical protein FEM55_19895 [Dyadobacter sediminis]GGC12708.1 hypothetical protein GCM10011325_44450 [Dyadobacter sediminis]
MKRSNLVLSVLFALILIITVGANLILKAEYDKIDKKDPLASYSKTALPAFHYLKLNGKTFGVTQIQQGNAHELRIIADPKYFRWKVTGDTLQFTYLRDWEKNGAEKDYELRATPTFYIIAPSVTRIVSNDAILKVNGWKNKNMEIVMNGGAVEFSKNKIEDLKLHLNTDVLSKIDGGNSFGKASFKVRDNSTLIVEKNIFRTLDIKVDSTAHISLPGDLLHKLP